MDLVTTLIETTTHDDGNIPRRIFWTLVGSAIAAIAAILTLSLWMSGEANRMAVVNSEHLLRTALQGEEERIAITTQDYAQWDEAFEWVSGRDDETVLANLGTGATESPTFDLLLITDASGTPLYAFEDGGDASDLSVFERLDVTELLDGIMGLPVEPYATLSTKVVQDSQLLIVSAGRIQPYETDGLTTAELPVLISASGLSSDDFLKIGHGLALEDVRLTPGIAEEDAPRLTLTDLSNRPVATISWTPPRPGDAMLSRALPVILTSSLLVLLGSTFVGRNSARQTARYLIERQRARTDALTGLLNRNGLIERLRMPDLQSAKAKHHTAVIFADINNFKALNDTLGHEAGDEALRALADRLCRSMRHSDLVARLGGDEFVAVVVDPNPEDAAKRICNTLSGFASEPVSIRQREIYVETAIGVALATGDASWNDLLVRADAAMYQAKHSANGEAVFAEKPRSHSRSHITRSPGLLQGG